MNIGGLIIAVGGGFIILMLYQMIGNPILIAMFAILLSVLLALAILYLKFRRVTAYGTRRFKTRITIYDSHTGFNIEVKTWPKPRGDEKMSQALTFSSKIIKHVHKERKKLESSQ